MEHFFEVHLMGRLSHWTDNCSSSAVLLPRATSMIDTKSSNNNRMLILNAFLG